MSPTPATPDLLEVIDRALAAALREVRRARALTPSAADAAHPKRAEGGKSMSQTSACEDILKTEGHPMHAMALIAALEKRGIRANRDSLVSALAKRLSPKGPFVRTGGNTFGLAVWPPTERA